MASVLTVNLAPEKQHLIRVLSIRLNFSCRDIRPDEQSAVISDLLNGTASSKSFGKPFRDEMIILDGFSHPDLNFILNELNRTGNTVPLKAVTTPTNIRWTVNMLHTQLVAENAEMARRSREVRK